jgi:branched-chain amino acid transport system substrate-binding protein
VAVAAGRPEAYNTGVNPSRHTGVREGRDAKVFGYRALPFLGIALVLSGCFAKADLPPVVIGHVSKLSGPGEHAMRGIRVAVEEANRDPDKGLGRPVVVRHTDTRGELAAFESEAVRLVAVNRAVALLGGTTPEEVERLERSRVPVVSRDGMRTRAMSDLVFFTGLSPEFRGQVLARFAAQDLKATTAAVFANERCEGAVALAEAFAHEFPAAVAKQNATAAPPRPVVVRYGKGAKPEELAGQVREAKPAVLLLSGDVGTVPGLLAALRQPELPVLLGGEGGAAALQANGVMGNPVYLVTAFVSDAETPQARAFVQSYQKAFGEEPDVHAALAYEGTQLLLKALRQAGSDYSSVQLRDRLASLPEFGPDHHVRRPAFVIRLEDRQPRKVKRFDPDK